MSTPTGPGRVANAEKPGAARRGARNQRRAARTASARPGFNPAESPLGWLARRRDKDGNALISEAQLHAGERLARDFWFAQMTPRVTADWSAPAGTRSGRRAAPGAGVELQDGVVAAGERVRMALRAVGPELSGILIDVCCHARGIEETERQANWPQRSGKIVLQLALTRLARHYGLVRGEGPESARGGRVSHWGTADFRPGVDPQE